MKMKISTTAMLMAGLLTSSALVASPAHSKPPNRNTTGGDTTTTSLACTDGGVSIFGIDSTRCAGSFDGNDVNDDGVGLLNSAFDDDGTWELVKDSNNGLFNHSGAASADWSVNAGKWTESFAGLTAQNYDSFAIALKSSTGFSFYTFEDFDSLNLASDLSNFASLTGSFNTAGASVNKKGMAQGLSHMTLYVAKTKMVEDKEDPVDIPEPFSILGLAVIGGIGATIKQRHD